MGLPEVPEEGDEVGGPLVRPEQHGVGDEVTLSTPGIISARRSAHARLEERVAGAPGDLRRGVQLGQQRLDRDQLLRRRRGENLSSPLPWSATKGAR